MKKLFVALVILIIISIFQLVKLSNLERNVVNVTYNMVIDTTKHTTKYKDPKKLILLDTMSEQSWQKVFEEVREKDRKRDEAIMSRPFN